MKASETDKQEQQEIETPKRINWRNRTAIWSWSILPPLGWLLGWSLGFLTNYYNILVTRKELEFWSTDKVLKVYGFRMGLLGFAAGWVITVIITILAIRATHPSLKSSHRVIMTVLMIIISWIPLFLRLVR